MGKIGEGCEDDACREEANPQVFGRGMKDFVGDQTADRTADHFQAVLVNDAVYADQRCRKGIGFIQEGDKVRNTAIYAVDQEDIARYEPDILFFKACTAPCHAC